MVSTHRVRYLEKSQWDLLVQSEKSMISLVQTCSFYLPGIMLYLETSFQSG